MFVLKKAKREASCKQLIRCGHMPSSRLGIVRLGSHKMFTKYLMKVSINFLRLRDLRFKCHAITKGRRSTQNFMGCLHRRRVIQCTQIDSIGKCMLSIEKPEVLVKMELYYRKW